MCWWKFTRFTSTVWMCHNDNASMYKLSSTNTCTMAFSQKIWTWIWTNWPSGMECLTYWPAYKRLTTRHVELLCPLQLPKSRCWEDRRAPAIYESFQAPGWRESTCSLISVKCQILQILAGPVASSGKSKCLYWVIPWCGKFPASDCRLKTMKL